MKRTERLSGPDVVRSLAVTAVLLTHMLGYSVKFNENMFTAKWFCFVGTHYAGLICVPLFLMLTGYFMNRKKCTKSFYGGLVPIILSYAVISALAVAANHLIGGETTPIPLDILHILDFRANEYSWYVEMYIGLFLLIPFLNMLGNALETKRQWAALFITLAVLTGLPDVFSSIIIANNKLDIIPDYWNVVYPLTYYFAGMYISRFKPKPKKPVCAAVALAAVALQTAMCAAFSQKEYAWWVMHGFGGLPVAICAVGVFLLLYDVSLKNRIARFAVREVALCSYEMYLLSYITDKYFYDRLGLSGIATFAVGFVSVFVGAKLLRLVTQPLSGLIKRLFREKPEKAAV